MSELHFENAFGQPPAEFTSGMVHALERVKEGKPMKKYALRTVILVAALLLALCGIALAVATTQGLDWFLTNRDGVTPPDDFALKLQSNILQDNTGDYADVMIQDAAWLDLPDSFFPNSFQITISATLRDTLKYEMHDALYLNLDGDESERGGADWLWTEEGHGPISEMMTDPGKQLALFEPGSITIGVPDGFVMLYSSDKVQGLENTVLGHYIFSMNELDPAWVQENSNEEVLQYQLSQAKAYQEAKSKYTDENGLTTLVFSYSVWEYPDRAKTHDGYVTFKVKLP